MTRPFEIRFAGQVFFDLNKEGNRLKENTVILAGGKHRRMLYAPAPPHDGLPCDPEWTEGACVVLDMEGNEFVAIDLTGVERVEVRNIDDNDLVADLPHVLDISNYVAAAPVIAAAPRTSVLLRGGLLEEKRIGGWVTGGVPLAPLCSEVVWKAAPLNVLDDNYQIVLRKGTVDFVIKLPPNAYPGPPDEPIVAFVSALCGWTGHVPADGRPVDFDGPEHLFGKRPWPKVTMSTVLRHPKTGSCPPAKRLSA